LVLVVQVRRLVLQVVCKVAQALFTIKILLVVVAVRVS
jgi:hypothetical protein